MRNEEIRTLIAYNRWANRRLLHAAARLDDAQLHAETWMSHRSVYGVLLHLLDTQRFWRQASQDGYADAKALDIPDLSALRLFWTEEDDALHAFAAGLSEDQLAGVVTYRWRQARPRKGVLWMMLMHIFNHGTQHRGEVGQYLASIGVPVGGVNFLTFTSRLAKSGK